MGGLKRLSHRVMAQLSAVTFSGEVPLSGLEGVRVGNCNSAMLCSGGSCK